jgi:hypothetical protein
MADGGNNCPQVCSPLKVHANQNHLLGGQWGMMNETGSYPGQAWLWLYTFWYQIAPFNTSTNADALVMMIIGALSLGLILIPFIPVRYIPRWVPLYRFIWRDHYRELRPPRTRSARPPRTASAPRAASAQQRSRTWLEDIELPDATREQITAAIAMSEALEAHSTARQADVQRELLRARRGTARTAYCPMTLRPMILGQAPAHGSRCHDGG